MKYLLDTCVISELIKPSPEPCVIKWIKPLDDSICFLSVLTLGELQKGIAKLPDSKKKSALQAWLEDDLRARFNDRILNVTPTIAELWGQIQGNAEKNGKKLPLIDSLIAATAINHHLVVATRNTTDMKNTGVHLFDPWQYS